MVNRIGPSIEHRYVSRFGFFEIELYQLELEIERIKRKIQLIQIKINKQEKIDMEKINKSLDEEFKSYQENLEKQKEEFNNSLKNPTLVLTKQDAKEIRNKYKTIVKKLHPDLNEGLSQKEKDLFIRATFSFKHGDVEGIRAIYEVVNGKNDTIEGDEDYLKKRIENLEEKIAEYKEEYPYNKKEIVENEIETKEYIEFLKNEINSYKEVLDFYKQELEELIFSGN